LLEASAGRTIAFDLAASGDRDRALAAIRRAQADAADLGMRSWTLSGHGEGVIHEWFGDAAAAISEYERGVRQLQEVGERGYLSTEASTLALLLLDVERVDDAREALRIAQETGAEDDIVTQVEVHATQARLLARDGDLAEAERLARAVVEEADATDYEVLFAHSRKALGDVLRLGGNLDEAVEVVEEAAANQERIGNRPYAATLRQLVRSWVGS
jgi:tetratricopeptide (TPR) repeat protein